jgi:hypothetical protein
MDQETAESRPFMARADNDQKDRGGHPCSVCRHPQRHLIDLAMCHRVPPRVLAQRFADLTKTKLARHRQNHLTPMMRASIMLAARPSEIDLDALKRSESEALLGSLIAQRARLQLIDRM